MVSGAPVGAPARAGLALTSQLADPKDKIDLFNLVWEGQSAAAEGQHERSFEIIRRVLSRDNSIFMAHSIQALNFLQLDRPGDAMPHLKRAAELRPDDAGARLYLGLAALKTGELNLSQQAFEKALALDPENDAARNNLGAIYIRRQEFQKAAGVFKEIVRRSPADVAAHVNLGVAYMMQKEPAEAQAAFERALQINPNLPEVHNNLGLIYLNQDKLDPAISHFNQALQLRPDYQNAQLNLAQAHRRKRNE